MPLLMPKQWTLEQLTADAAASKAIFRTQRLDEEPDAYRDHYDTFRPVVTELVESLAAVAAGSQDICPYLETKIKWAALRYITAPPISNDDLATLANVRFDKGFILRPADVASTTAILLQLADPFRFPWVPENRTPTVTEIEFAVASTSTMLAAQAIETYRRTLAKREQENAVKQALESVGMSEVPALTQTSLATAPIPNTFCGETKFGGTKADVVARLADHRVMLIECKSSNSEVNSYKRINHEAAGKAKTWRNRIGSDNVVPSATISGVFKAPNLQSAQEDGLNIFWQFRLDDLVEFVETVQT